MWKSIILGLLGCAALSSEAIAQSCASLPYTLTNGNAADANQVMANFSCVFQSPVFSGPVGIGGVPLNPQLLVATSNNATGFNLVSPDIGIVHNSNASGVGDQSSPAGLVIVRDKATQVVNGDQLGGVSWNARFDAEDRAGYASITAIAESGETAALTFNVATTTLTTVELMRLDSSGNVGINTTSPSYTLHVNGSVAGTSAYNNLSDQRLKKNIRPIGSALSIIDHLSGVRFEWKTTEERAIGKSEDLPVGKPQVGFVAQDVEKVLPEAVSTANGPDAIKSVAESKIAPVLVEAVKELKAANENQAAELRDLETRMTLLERKVRVRTAQR